MTGREVVRHDPHTSHADKDRRWFAVCEPCGWVRAAGGENSAKHLADLHRRLNPAPDGDAA